MRLRSLCLLVAGCLVLTACGSSRPIYSGHEASTEGVPGFEDGKKMSPYIKLGQSYKVDGTWYTPRFQPDYDEVGLASWYGPGFHGGATANGEIFDKHSMTAAHKTLPLPSIVKVTLVETGKSIYVRINDRGPFVNDRIIDLSYGAANAIGLMKKGVAKVRVQYMLGASQRFADLLSQGRSPDSIDVASEVLPYANDSEYASNQGSWLDHLSPISSAQAHDAPATPDTPSPAPNAVPVADVTSVDLPAPQAAAAVSAAQAVPANSPFDVMKTVEAAPPPATAMDPPPMTSPPAVAYASPPPQPPPALPASLPEAVPPNAMFVQLGSYSQQPNAVAMVKRVMGIGPARITITPRGDATLYRVRLGPYGDPAMADEVLARVHQMGLTDARFVRP